MKAERISDQTWPDDQQPVVSVICAAYNHEKYLAVALEGFLRQETTFPVEVLVSDDASSDSTAAIVRDYASRFPRVIRPVLHEVNQRSQGIWPMLPLMTEARGRFLAICEGDDYWTSADKLEKQIAALEAQDDASACVHRADGRFEESGELIEGYFGPPAGLSSFGIDDILAKGNFVATASVVFRKTVFREIPTWLHSLPHCDMALLCIAALAGPIICIDESMAVYRKHGAGIHSRDHVIHQHLKGLETYYAIGEKLSVSDRPSFREGVDTLERGIVEKFQWYESRIAELEGRIARDRVTIDGIMKSKTFRVGLALSRVRDKLRESQSG